MREIAIISDIHSNLPALRNVLREISGMEAVCCGDLVGYNPFPNEVVEIIKKNRIVSILGNHDHAVITGDTSWFNPIAAEAIEWTRNKISSDNLAFLKTLPRIYENDFFMVHGSPRNELEEYVYEDYPLEILKSFFTYTKRNSMILGHTHVPFAKKIDGKLLFNPGSVGQPRDGDARAAYAIFDIDTMSVALERAEYDIDEVANAIEKNGLPLPLAHRLYLGF